MKQIYKKHIATIALIWGACMVLFVFAYMIMIAPQEARKRALQVKLAETEKLCLQARQATEKKAKNELMVAVEELDKKLSAFTIEPDESSDLIFDIGKIAGRQQVRSFSAKIRQSNLTHQIPQAEYIKKSDINITYMSEFPQFAKLLNSLERHNPIIFIDEFSITRSDRAEISNIVSMDLKVFVRNTTGS